jgi:CRISPR/Cas system-associated exonuclease Cas4 (RecB family)
MGKQHETPTGVVMPCEPETMPSLVKKYYDHATAQIKVWPCHSNRASSIGGDCERQLVYERTSWDQKTPHEVDLELIFREGRVHEEAVLRDLRAAGIEILEQQTALSWPEYQLTGHVDGVIVVDGKAVPIEIKSSSDHIWRSIAYRGRGVYAWHEVERAFQGKPWLRRYLAQLQVYMLCKNSDVAILLMKNKSTGALLQINVPLDYGYAESLIQRCERINAHVAAGTLPDRIPYGEDTCGECPFAHLCLPDMPAGKKAIAFVPDEEAAKKFDARAAAEDASQTFKDMDEWVKSWAWERYPDNDRIAVGHWLVEKKRTKGGARITKISALPKE